MKIPSPADCGLPTGFTHWRSNQEEAISVMITSAKRAPAICAPTGFGKCFHPETEVLMNDGSVKYIDSIEPGDLVMGPDSEPRRVESICYGSDHMFDIVPTSGDKYTVNSDHILTLKLTPDEKGKSHERVDLTVSDYLRRNTTFKHRAKGYRVPVYFEPSSYLPVDPYYLGLWLGDGTASNTEITTSDSEVVDYIQYIAETIGLKMTKHPSTTCPRYGIVSPVWGGNHLLNSMKDLGVIGNKHIPHIYKTSSRRDRLRLLAGILDSDGGLVANTCFEVTLKIRRLAHDVAYVSRSLGFAATVKIVEKSSQFGTSGYYYRVGINGNTDYIPTVLERKQAKEREQIKNVRVTGIKVVPRGVGDYFGFTLDHPDQRFLLSDFTVVHNSLVVAAVALLSKKPTCIVTESRGLQDDYVKQFSSIGLVDIRGRSNYKCDMKDDYTCEEGYAARCPYKGTVGCPSSQAEMAAATSRLVVTNYDKWISAKRFGQGMDHFKQVIFDEGHAAIDALSRALQVTISHREVEDILQMDFPRPSQIDNFQVWKDWASHARAIAEQEAIAARNRVNNTPDPKPSWVKHYNHMKHLCRKLSLISLARVGDWVTEEINIDGELKGYQFDPIRPGKYAESNLMMRIPKVVVVSATLRPKTLYMMGIGKENFEFKEFDSDFDPRRSPIYYIPTMRVDSRNADMMSHLWLKHDQFAARRRDRKAIVQTVSFARQKEILEASRFSDSMLINERGEPPTEMIEQFRAMPPESGAIFVSPSIGTGYDFKDEDCRWNMLCKIPFDPPSKVLKAREQDDPEYRGYKAIQKMIQNFGRDKRSKTDWSEGLICDMHLDWFLPRFGHLAPRSFFRLFKKTGIIPPPLRREDMM